MRVTNQRRRRERPTAAGFTDLPGTRFMVQCDYCGRLCRRRGISGHKQKCGGWRRQFEPSGACDY